MKPSRRVPTSRIIAAVLLASALSTQAAERITARVQPANRGPEAASPSTPAATTKEQGRWLSSLEDGRQEARKQSRPILVRAGATWCGWCRKLEEEIKKPAVQKSLSDYVLVYLDIDDSPKEAQSLGIEAVPALRVLSPAGRVVASQNGFLAAKDLADWLTKQQPKAGAATPPSLSEEGPPNAKALDELVDQLRGRESLFREAAIQRLTPHRDIAAAAIVRLFTEGGLSERLAALELLNGWKAPTKDLDPWRPETITPQRMESLATWAREVSKKPASAPAQLEAPSIEDAGRELARLLQADQEAEAEVVRERLARLGPAILPMVLQELKQAAKDRDRERLTALRYRVVAPARLTMEWPGGFERLASMDAQTRQRAVDDLAKLAQADAAPLLRELFSNPDPMVREVSLRTLRKVGGEEANESLMGLLGDPELNVRAAVLKQLTEQPSRKLAPKLADYVAQEKDADLLVHAARVLRATGGKESLDVLSKMTGHEAWQVRAEVAEAIGEVLNDSSLPQNSRADAYAALVGLLKDPDGFVVSRAMAGLSRADANMIAKPLVQATLEHPEMAGALVEMLTQRGGNPTEIARHLSELLKAKDAKVRAAAIIHHCRLRPRDSEQQILAAFGDSEEEVRLAAAKGFLSIIESYRPAESGVHDLVQFEQQVVITGGEIDQPTILSRLITGSSGTATVQVTTAPSLVVPTQAKPQPQPADPNDWLERFRTGADRPKWMDQVVAPLEAMLANPQPENRITAAVGLIALGRDQAALATIRDVLKSQHAMANKAAQALGWLPRTDRMVLFSELIDLSSETQTMIEVINAMATVPDPRAGQPLWELLGRTDLAAGWADTIQNSLRRLYFGRSLRRPGPSTAQQKALVAEIEKWLGAGPEIRQAVALSLLLTASGPEAARAGRQLYEDAKTAKKLRADALQIMLLGQSREQSVKTAVSALSHVEDESRGVALQYLAYGKSQLRWLQGTVSVQPGAGEPAIEDLVQGGSPITPQAPPGLKPGDIRPLLQSSDQSTRAHAGYLLALLKQRDGLDVLLEYWRKHARDDASRRRQVYRAVTALNDDKLTPVLEEVFRDVVSDDAQLREFYWTIRSMDGEKVLELRKKIRTEVGMDRLK